MSYLYNGVPSDVHDIPNNGMTEVDMRNTACIKGDLFRYQTLLSIPTESSAYISFTTGDNPVKVYSTNVSTSADKVTYDYLENAIVSGGTLESALAHNRVNVKSGDVTIRLNPTITDEGNVISGSYLPGSAGVGQSRTGVSSGGGSVIWNLKPNTTYLLKFHNGSTAENLVHITETWIEVI